MDSSPMSSTISLGANRGQIISFLSLAAVTYCRLSLSCQLLLMEGAWIVQ